jgi:uncharacterized protein
MIAPTLRQYFETLRDTRVAGAWLFGSHAAGRAHRESDIDVAVLLDRAALPGRSQRAGLRVRLISDLIGTLQCNDVDVVVLNDVPPLFARSILRTGRLLHAADPPAVRDFSRDTQLRAADVEPFVRRGRQRLLEALRR